MSGLRNAPLAFSLASFTCSRSFVKDNVNFMFILYRRSMLALVQKPLSMTILKPVNPLAFRTFRKLFNDDLSLMLPGRMV